jgi:hypothetical protein
MFVHDIAVEDCRTELAKATFGRLSCAHENQPYIIPINFAADGNYIYLFSMPGQKIDWMRENPRVCLELDSIHGQNEWTSIVVMGRYEELPDTPDLEEVRRHALELLRRRPMWWEASAVAPASHAARPEETPVVYRIHVEQLTGRRGAPGPHESGMPPGLSPDAKRATH